MKALVAYRGPDDGPEALYLGRVLKATTGAELTVASVLPRGSEPGEDRVDLEYRQWLDQVEADARGGAAAELGGVAFERIGAKSVAAGLADAATSWSSDVLVLGCASAATQGHLLVGSVADRLLHSSPAALLLAPCGYDPKEGAEFSGLTVAYAGTAHSREALAAACSLAQEFGVPLRVATFVPRAKTMYPPETGFDAEDMVAAQWAEQAVELHEQALEFCRSVGVTDVSTAVGRGNGWDGALSGLDWDADEVLIIGSSRLGPLARVFLGSTATKIMRHSLVPVLVVPSSARA